MRARPEEKGTVVQKTILAVFLLALLLALPPLSSAGLLLQHHITYTVAAGDTLSSIAYRMDVSVKSLAEDNGLDPSQSLRAGRILRIKAFEIVPETLKSGVLIDIPGSMLHLFEAGVPVMSTPVGLGKPKKEDRKGWETPAGDFTISGRLRNPDWKVPDSVQEEMRREGLSVRESYPPGPKNPVGGYVLQTTLPGILIHDTIDSASIGRFMSHGCVRLLRPDMEQLFGLVSKGMKGATIYRPVKVARLGDGRIFMEVNRDVYGRVPDLKAEAKKVLKKAGLFRLADMKKVEAVVKVSSGIPEDITLKKK